MNTSFLDNFKLLCGRHRVEGEDPYWTHLFHGEVLVIHSAASSREFHELCLDLVQNNHISNNYIELINQTSTRLRQLVGNLPRTPEEAKSWCGPVSFALYLSAVVFQFFASNDNSNEVLRQTTTNC